MLSQTMGGALARGKQAELPTMNFGEMTLGWQRDSSLARRLLAMPAVWAWPAGDAVRTERTES